MTYLISFRDANVESLQRGKFWYNFYDGLEVVLEIEPHSPLYLGDRFLYFGKHANRWTFIVVHFFRKKLLLKNVELSSKWTTINNL